MGRIIYDGNRIIPAPLASISRESQFADDGTKIGSVYTITLTGTLLTYKGSPNSSKVFWTAGGYPPDENIDTDARLAAMLRKQEALFELFGNEGKTLEIQSDDGSAPLKCNPRVVSPISFEEGIWFNTCRYTITFQADCIEGLGNCPEVFTEYIDSASESWVFETDEDNPESVELNRSYRLTHTLSAKGKRFYDDTGTLVKPAWEWAKQWAIARLGIDNQFVTNSGINDLPSYYGGFNHIRSDQSDEVGGSYSVTETWILASGSALEDFNIESTTSLEDGKTRVNVQGTIRGLEIKNGSFQITSSKYTNADTKWSGVKPVLVTRAQNYSGKTLNIQPLNQVVGINPAQGTISYSYEYDNRPSNIISDTIAENIQLSDNFGVDAIAAIGVLGRTAGPVLQSLNSHRETTRSLSIDLVFNPEVLNSGSVSNRLVTNHPNIKEPYKTEIQSIVDSVRPTNAGLLNNAGVAASTTYLVDQNTQWDGSRYSLNLTWIYE